jgi:hypothetical protein
MAQMLMKEYTANWIADEPQWFTCIGSIPDEIRA